MKTSARLHLHALAFLVAAFSARASFEIGFFPSILYVPVSSGEVRLIQDATIETNGAVTWAGGILTVTISSNYVSGPDHVGIKNTGFGATALTIENTGGSVNIKYGSNTFATASNFLPGTNVTSGGQLVCTFEANATTPAVEALLRSISFKKDNFGYPLFETNILAQFPAVKILLTLADNSSNSVSAERQVLFPKIIELRCQPPVLFYPSTNVVGRTENMTSIATFDNGDQTARLGNQITYYAPNPVTTVSAGVPNVVYFTGLDTGYSSGIVHGSAYATVSPSLSAGFCLSVNGGEFDLAAFNCDGSEGDGDCVFLSLLACLIEFIHKNDSCFSGSFALNSGYRKNSMGESISLPTFYALESLMRQTAEGKRLARLYRYHSPELITIVLVHTDLIDQGQNLLGTWQPFVSGLLAGRGTNVITPSMVNGLNTIWNQLTNYASPTLRTNLIAERGRFNYFQDFTNKNFIQWAQMLQITVPTNAFIRLSTPSRTNGQFVAQANYASGLQYSLDRSVDFTNWFPVTTLKIVTNNNLSITLTDTNSPSSNTFYRAVAVKPPN
jgi:hypothetical protein